MSYFILDILPIIPNILGQMNINKYLAEPITACFEMFKILGALSANASLRSLHTARRRIIRKSDVHLSSKDMANTVRQTQSNCPDLIIYKENHRKSRVFKTSLGFFLHGQSRHGKDSAFLKLPGQRQSQK